MRRVSLLGFQHGNETFDPKHVQLFNSLATGGHEGYDMYKEDNDIPKPYYKVIPGGSKSQLRMEIYPKDKKPYTLSGSDFFFNQVDRGNDYGKGFISNYNNGTTQINQVNKHNLNQLLLNYYRPNDIRNESYF